MMPGSPGHEVTMRRFVPAVLLSLCLFAAPPARATTVEGTLDAFASAVLARANDANAAPREASKLNLVVTALASISPGDGLDTLDLAAILRASRALAQSRTTDPTVVSSAAAFVRCLVAEGRARVPQLVTDLQSVFSSATQSRIQAKLDAAEAAAIQAELNADSDPALALGFARGALRNLNAAATRLASLLQAYAGAGVLYRQSSDLVGNDTPRRIRILRVECNVDVDPESSEPFHLSGDISAFASPSYRLPYDLNPTFFFDYDNAVGGAIYDRIGGEFANFRGAVRLVLQGYPPVDLPVLR